MTCDSCGKPIIEIGWRCYPAIVAGRQLVGTVGSGEEARPVGDGIDICANCLKKVKHPNAEVPS